MVVVDPRETGHLVAVIQLGVPGNLRAIDVYLLRDGERSFAGRVRVPDLSPTTLGVAASVVAPMIARQAWGLAHAETVHAA